MNLTKDSRAGAAIRNGPCKEFGGALAMNSSLTRLNLEGEMERLRYAMGTPPVTHGELPDNLIGEEGGKEIGRALAFNSALTFLNLSSEDAVG